MRQSAFAAILALLCAAAAAQQPVGLLESDGTRLQPEWKTHVSQNNAISIKNQMLEIRAAENTYAHIERELGSDFVRISCLIKPSPGTTWATSVFVYWNEGNWSQLAVIGRNGGTFYVTEMIDQQPHEYELGNCKFDQWHKLAIELGADCIRYMAGNGDDLKKLAVHYRPEPFNSLPQLLVLGKGFGGPAAYPAADLNNDFADRGPMGVSLIGNVSVEPLDLPHIRQTAEERKERETAMLDTAGLEELARDQDPCYDTVSKHFPAMKRPREVVGVKDHPHFFGVAHDGTLQINDDVTRAGQPCAFFEIGDSKPYRFGSDKDGCRKHLLNGWMPVVVAEDEHDGLRLEQTVFAESKDMSADQPLYAWVNLKITNTGSGAARTSVRLRMEPAATSVQLKPWDLEIPGGEYRSVQARIPYLFKEASVTSVAPDEFDRNLKSVTQYWDKLIAQGSRFQIPEQRVQDAYRAWLSYNFLNVRKRDGKYHICDGSGFYGIIYGYSAVLYCYVLDLMGYQNQATEYLDSLLSFQQPDGLFYLNFGHTDTGTMLTVLADHYRITGDADWLKRVAPKMTAMCNWIASHRKESQGSAHGKRSLVHGLIRFRPYCDYEQPAFDYYADCYLCVGMEAAAEVLSEVGMQDEAARISREAREYRKDILLSMDAAVITREGMRMLPLMPDTHFLLKETNYTANGYYGLVDSCVLETGFLPAKDRRTNLLVDMLVKRGGLASGVCQFFGQIDHAYTYGYWQTCMKRDEVKPVILGLYGSLAYGMSRETYAAVECTAIRTGENAHTLPHTYSNTKQLRLLRNMLLREDEDQLLIGYCVPRPWLAPGKHLEVKDSPTSFGLASFSMDPNGDGSAIQVSLKPPVRQSTSEIRVRLRQHAGAALKSIETTSTAKWQIEGDVVRFTGLREPVEFTAKY